MMDWPADFAQFIAAYPAQRRNLKKRDALKAWQQLLKRGVKPESIMFTLKRRVNQDWAGREASFIPYPGSFLRSEDWDEEIEACEDDKEPLLPLFKQDQTEFEKLQLARAEMIQKKRKDELAQWEIDSKSHRHDELCQLGEVCRFAEDKRPEVPTIALLLELLSHKIIS